MARHEPGSPAGLFLCMQECFDAIGNCIPFPQRELRVPETSGREQKVG